jgi:hypothetical protein
VLSFVIIAIGLLLFIAVAFAIGSVFVEPRNTSNGNPADSQNEQS